MSEAKPVVGQDAVSWSIHPGRGVGPLRLGMPLDAAIRAVGSAGRGPVERAQKGSKPVWANDEWSILIYPAILIAAGPDLPAGYAAEAVDEIELLPPARVDLFGRPLLGLPLASIEAFFRETDARTERHGGLVEVPALGLRVWSGGEPPDWPISSVSVTRPTPSALVLAPDLTFAELDQAVRALHFTGGATTRLVPLLAGEPEVAEWNRRHILLRYTFDPVSMLRVLHLDGPEAPETPPVRKLVTRLPQLTVPQVLAGLDSSDDVVCLRAIQAAAVLRLVSARDKLARLSRQAPPPLRTAAISTLVGLPDY
jgi:hypothetical protein